MGLFFEVLSAINNPNQQASIGQLSSITNSVQQLAFSSGMDSTQMQGVLSALGGLLRPVLQQQSVGGGSQFESLVAQFSGDSSNLSAIQTLIPPPLQQQLIQEVAQKTGLNASMIQAVLPTLIPVVMNLLHMGASTPETQGSNAILNTFLDGDGDTDLGDALKFANRFLNSTP